MWSDLISWEVNSEYSRLHIRIFKSATSPRPKKMQIALKISKSETKPQILARWLAYRKVRSIQQKKSWHFHSKHPTTVVFLIETSNRVFLFASPPPLIGLDKVFLSITLTINYQVLASSSNLSNFFIWQCTHIETRFPEAAHHIVRLERMGKGRKATYNAIGSCTLGKKLPCNSW